MRGRKPKPSGMSTRRPDRDDDIEIKLPPCPKHLNDEAKREWRRMGKKLLAVGLVTEVDSGTLALYCQAWARWVEAEAMLAKFGTVVTTPSGFLTQSPYLQIANKAMEQMTRLLVEFGMSPSSRARVTRTAPAPVKRQIVQRSFGDDPRQALRAVK